MQPNVIANSPYVWFNRVLLYLAVIFAIISIISMFSKKIYHLHRLFKNLSIFLFLVYILLVIIDYDQI